MILKTIKWILIILGLLTVLGFLVQVGVVTAAAQESPENATDTANNSSDSGTDYEWVASDSLRMIESHWDGKTYVMTFEADVRTDVTLTDAGMTSENNENTFPTRKHETVSSEGTTTLRITVQDVRQVWIEDENGNFNLKGYDDGVDSQPDGENPLRNIVLTGSIIFAIIVASAVAFKQVIKNTIKRLF
jgi:hypothetical protein